MAQKMMFEGGMRQRTGVPFGSPELPSGMPIREDKVCPCLKNKESSPSVKEQTVFAAGNGMPLGIMDHGQLSKTRNIAHTFGISERK